MTCTADLLSHKYECTRAMFGLSKHSGLGFVLETNRTEQTANPLICHYKVMTSFPQGSSDNTLKYMWK